MFRSSRRLIAVLGTTVVAALAATLLSSTSQASGPPSPSLQAEPSGVGPGKPTVVMVHGAWADSSGLVPLGRAAAARASRSSRSPTLCGAHLPTPPTSAARSRPSTVPSSSSSHSYSGSVITGAATGLPNIDALVYVAAFVPDEVEPVGALYQLNSGSLITGTP